MYEDLKKKIIDYKNTDGKKLIYFGKNVVTTDTVVSRSLEFKTTSLFNEIMEATKFLPESTALRDRERCIFQDITNVPNCQICGEPISIKPTNRFNVPCFGTAHVCESKKCAAKYASSSRKPCSGSTKDLHAKSRCLNLKRFEEAFQEIVRHVNQCTNISTVELETCQLFCKDRIEKQIKNKPVFKLTDSTVHPTELETLLRHTNFIPIDSDNEKSLFRRLHLDERAYCLVNGITRQPECELCGKKLPFIRASVGYSHTCGNPECVAERNRLRHGMKKLCEYEDDINKDKFEVLHFPSCVTTEKLVVRCKRCGTVSEWDVSDGRLKTLHENRLCRVCDRWTSSGENDLADFVIGLLQENERKTVMRNCRSVISPLELDIYIPSRKIAFEYDGIFWHSEESGHGVSYHLNKTNQCEKLGIHLVHVFESEWEQKRELVKARIRNLLLTNISFVQPIKRRASELTLDSNVDSKEAADFLSNNHIQGAGNFNVQTVRIGLRNNDSKLISLMTFAKCKHSSRTEWELMRFCSDPNYRIFGNASRMLRRFIEKYNPKSIVSYADRRWTMNNGNTVYDKLGFKLDHVSAPNYWYWKYEKVDSFNLQSRLKFQKHKLPKLLEHFDPNLSEAENMIANGYTRIFDCGNLVYVKECK